MKTRTECVNIFFKTVDQLNNFIYIINGRNYSTLSKTQVGDGFRVKKFDNCLTIFPTGSFSFNADSKPYEVDRIEAKIVNNKIIDITDKVVVGNKINIVFEQCSICLDCPHEKKENNIDNSGKKKIIDKPNTNYYDSSFSNHGIELHSQENESLSQENKTLRWENEKLSLKTEKLSQENNELSQKYEELSQKNEELSQENNELSQENNELSQKNEELSQENNELSRKNEELSQENNELSQKNEELSQENNTFQRQVKEITAKYEEEETKIKKIRSEISDDWVDILKDYYQMIYKSLNDVTLNNKLNNPKEKASDLFMETYPSIKRFYDYLVEVSDQNNSKYNNIHNKIEGKISDHSEE